MQQTTQKSDNYNYFLSRKSLLEYETDAFVLSQIVYKQKLRVNLSTLMGRNTFILIVFT